MRRAAKVDCNQKEIVENLRAIGCSVAVISALGKGVPDLLVGDKGYNYLFEIKDGTKSPSRRKLTKAEEDFFRNWQGSVEVINSSLEAVNFILENRDY